MSFYGSIYTVIGNAFKRLKFVNKGKTDFSIPSSPQDHFLVDAIVANDCATIGSGNSWLGFMEEDNKAILYHLAPSNAQASEIQNIVTGINPAGASDVVIGLNDVVTISSPTFDPAGHINGYTSQSYQLDTSDYYTKTETDDLITTAIKEIPDLTEALKMLEVVSDLEEAVGLPEEDVYPEAGLLYRTNTLETEMDECQEQLDIVNDILGISLDENGTPVSEMAQRLTDVEANIGNLKNTNAGGETPSVETIIGDLSTVGVVDDDISVSSLFGDLSKVKLEPKEMSVAGLLGDFSLVSQKRESLAEILGNLDSAVGTNRNFAEELGILQKTVSLLVKTVEGMSKDLEKLEEEVKELTVEDKYINELRTNIAVLHKKCKSK